MTKEPSKRECILQKRPIYHYTLIYHYTRTMTRTYKTARVYIRVTSMYSCPHAHKHNSHVYAYMNTHPHVRSGRTSRRDGKWCWCKCVAVGVLQCVAVCCSGGGGRPQENTRKTYCNTLQHTATDCYTLLHTATHCNTL